MTNFTGVKCPVCEKAFNKDDRPVICTYCGAPYHRDCYNRQGFCVFTDAHSNGYEWTPHAPEKEIPEEPAVTPEEKIYGGLREMFEKMGISELGEKETLSADERFLFGVSEKEISHFQGGITPLRLIRYRRIASGHKISINVFAGIFSPYYLFYARMRMAGAVIMLITFILTLPTWISLHYADAPDTAPFTPEELERAMSSLGFFSFALMIILALFFDYFYLRWSAYKIKQIRSRFAPDALSGRPEIPDAPSVSPKLTGLSDEYYRCLQSAGQPGFRYMLLDGLAAALIIAVLYSTVISSFLTGG